MAISQRGLDFVVRHEGFVSRAYRCPAGVWSIGTGFTNRSSVAVEMLGPIGPGMSITRSYNDRVLAQAFARDYGPPVDRAMAGAQQHELDAGYSYCFNCGPGAMGDVWVGWWRDGRKFEAAERLKKTRITANGIRLQGLVNRRAAEAKLLITGIYGEAAPAHEAPDEYRQKLVDLGYADVLAFQKHHPNLVNDALMGPATRAQIDREIAARREGAGVGTGVAVGVGLAAWLAAQASALAVGAGVIAAAVMLWFVVRRREEIIHWIGDRRN